MINYSEIFNTTGFVAHFSNNDCNYTLEPNRNRFISEVDLDYKYARLPSQTHSSNIKIVNSSASYQDTDGLISTSKIYSLGILVADCIPVFLFDSKTKYFGLVHSGWRGTVSKITNKAINLFVSFGSKAEDIQLVLGPAIGHCCFEIEEDIAHLFKPKFLSKKNSKKFSYDLKNAVIDDLILIGVEGKKIINDDQCTFCNSKSFFSYRRQKDSAGRMLALMGWIDK